MLKITRVEGNEEITLRLYGSVTGQWIDLLRASANSVLDEGRRLLIDLKEISFIDCEGLALIQSLMGRGASHVNAPLFLADQLRKCKAAEGE
jgi:ABC-type transporter Mla MlaB component